MQTAKEKLEARQSKLADLKTAWERYQTYEPIGDEVKRRLFGWKPTDLDVALYAQKTMPSLIREISRLKIEIRKEVSL